MAGLGFDPAWWQVDFEDICPIVDTVTDLPVPDKRALLRDVAHRAALVLNVGDDIVFDALLKREDLGSTGVGDGVAIPHVRLEQVKTPFGIMARLRDPIDFEAVDGQPVDLVCLLSSKPRRPRRAAPRAQSRGALQRLDREDRPISVGVKRSWYEMPARCLSALTAGAFPATSASD
jgi:hypothetical protein